MNPDRRRFLKTLSYSALVGPLGFQLTKSVFAGTKNTTPHPVPEKKSLSVLSDRPLILESSQDLLDDEVTPTEKMFVRNNGIVPPIAYSKDIKDWRLKIDGEVERPYSFSMDDLKSKFKAYTYQLVLECGGNGRAGFLPRTEGAQWTYGGVGCPLWEGVRLKDILDFVGLKKSAFYLAYYSHDLHLSGNPDTEAISRGFPITKALDEMTLLTYAMNGKPLPPLHGFPARLLCPGYPASASGKWLKHLWVRNCVHDGAKMTGYSYRVPKFPVAPGSNLSEKDFKIIEEMPVKSIITFPRSGSRFKWTENYLFRCRGFAWSGHGEIQKVHLSCDYGQTWLEAKLKRPRNRYAWQRWEASVPIASEGYYELWARATDATGKMQSMLIGNWNPQGYLNNAMPRIAFYADA